MIHICLFQVDVEAGACISWMQLQPRIFAAKSEAQLRKIIGKTIVREVLSGLAVNEVVIRCEDQKAAAKAYKAAVAPRLVTA